jgi:dipeptidyl aminopeptidase/acylaminoacyl peptidase
MPDIHERLAVFNDLEAPELWNEVRNREPRPPVDDGPSRARTIGIVLLAFAIATAGIGLAVRAFTRSSSIVPVAPAVSNGKIAFARLSGAHWQIDTVNPDGTSATTLAAVAGDATHPTWSTEGHRILFDLQSGGRTQIYVVSDDGAGSTQLTDGPGWNYLPAWSSDGQRIAFVSTRDGNDEIYVMNADGTNQVRLTNSPDEDLSPSWAPDGSRIAFQSNRAGNNEIYVMNGDGADVTRLTDDPAAFDGDPAWSPDGRRIAFTSVRNGAAGLYTMNVDGTDVAQLTRDTTSGQPLDPAWSPDGTSIAYTARVDGTNEIFVFDLSTRSLRSLPGAVGNVCCPSWQPVPVEQTISNPSESISSAPTATARVTGSIDVGVDVRAVTYGEGSVWVAVSDGDGFRGHILRIDPTSAKTIADITVATVPTWEVGGGGLTVRDGSVWVAGATNGEGTYNSPGGGTDALLLRIDTATNQVVDRISLGGLAGADVAVDDRGVWVMIAGAGNQMEVDRIDPATDQVAARVPLPSGYGHFIVAAGGYIVAATKDESTGDTILNVIDPETDALIARKPSNGVGWPATDGDLIYATATDSIVGLEPSTGEVTQTYSGVNSTGDALAVGEGGVWFLSPQDRSAVYRLNTATGDVDVDVALPGATPIAMTTSPGAVWVLDYEGRLLKVSLNIAR